MSNFKVGDMYITESQQLRKITKISKDVEGRTRISYNSKSAKKKNRQFEYGHTLGNPPLETTFQKDMGNLLSNSEKQELVSSGILEQSEL